MIREVAENLREYLDPSHYPMVDEYVASLGIPRSSALPVVADRMPAGSSSDNGSDDGVSTRYKDLAEELETKRAEVMAHRWFTENPHWTVGLCGGDTN